MKNLALCLLLSSLVIPACAAQDEAAKAAANENDTIVRLWRAHANDADDSKFEDNNLIISSDPDSRTCMYMRVYKVKRESRHSDATIPNGYTTCVSWQRNPLHNAVGDGDTNIAPKQ